MAKSWPRLIRDPIHDIISFEDNDCDRLLLALINTREFQRLRRIKQLGMSEMVFPGGNHSRFAHAIGVMHNARRFLERIGKLATVTIEQRTAVLIAALLHDLGHGPFSHAFEKITGEDHESRTVEIITNTETEVNQVLRSHDASLPELLRKFFEVDPESAPGPIPAYLVQVISSQLDADRFDYLLRDSHATGAEYGRFDSRWIIQHLLIDEGKKRLYLSKKARTAAETYVFARYHMYRAVYFHKTTRAAEVMLKLLFQRFKMLLSENKNIVPNAPQTLIDAFTSQGAMPLSDYLQLDDYTVSEFFKACQAATDQQLSELATGILDRKLYKAVDASLASGHSTANFVTAVNDHLTSKNSIPKDCLIVDAAADTPYKPYDPDSDKPNNQIYIEDSFGNQQEFGVLSPQVQALKTKYALVRYYFPSEHRKDIEQLAKQHLEKE